MVSSSLHSVISLWSAISRNLYLAADFFLRARFSAYRYSVCPQPPQLVLGSMIHFSPHMAACSKNSLCKQHFLNLGILQEVLLTQIWPYWLSSNRGHAAPDSRTYNLPPAQQTGIGFSSRYLLPSPRSSGTAVMWSSATALSIASPARRRKRLCSLRNMG